MHTFFCIHAQIQTCPHTCTCDVAATHRHIQKSFCILLEQEATKKLLQKTCSIKATQIIGGANTQLASALCRREGLLCIWGEEGYGSRPMTAKRLQLKVTWSDLTHSHPHLRLEKKFPITRSIAAQLDCKKTKKTKLMTTSKWSCVFFVCLFGFFSKLIQNQLQIFALHSLQHQCMFTYCKLKKTHACCQRLYVTVHIFYLSQYSQEQVHTELNTHSVICMSVWNI